MAELAQYFWYEVSALFDDRPVYVRLNDFIRWIAANIEMPATTAAPFAELGANTAPNAANPRERVSDQIPDNNYTPGRFAPDSHTLRQWAANFACRLTNREQQVFYWHYIQEYKLGAVAEKLGYKSPSGPEYAASRAADKLRAFLRDLPLLSPDAFDEPDEAVFLTFMEFLGEFLKNMAETL